MVILSTLSAETDPILSPIFMWYPTHYSTCFTASPRHFRGGFSTSGSLEVSKGSHSFSYPYFPLHSLSAEGFCGEYTGKLHLFPFSDPNLGYLFLFSRLRGGFYPIQSFNLTDFFSLWQRSCSPRTIHGRFLLPLFGRNSVFLYLFLSFFAAEGFKEYKI